MIEGGCFCGEIRYQIEDGEHLAVTCHCSMCRRTSGAPFVVWLVVPKAGFDYTSGKPKVLDSSEHGKRYFCSSCGTPVACMVDSHPDFIDVTLGSLDYPQTITPTQEIYTDSKLPWVMSRTEEPT